MDLLVAVAWFVAASITVVIGGSIQLSLQHWLEEWAQAHPCKERVHGKSRRSRGGAADGRR